MDAAAYEAWYRTARGRWIGEVEFRLLRSLLRPEDGESLLDLGCGTGYFTRRFATEARLQVIGLDPGPAWLAFAQAHGSGDERYCLGHAEALPFENASFDYAISVTALCFVADQRSALREMLRVTRKRFALGLLNRHSLLYLQKGRRGGAGAYRGAHWHTVEEVRALLDGLPVANLELRTAVLLPQGGVLARGVERVVPTRSSLGGFIAAVGEVGQ
jgi:SAM-dependent methyltransferase